MNGLSNVFAFSGELWDPSQERLYSLHLQRLLVALSSMLGDKFPSLRFVVYYHPTYQEWPEFPVKGKDVVLILLSDEAGIIPDDLSSQFFAIFKTYWPLPYTKENIISFPLGYSNSIDGINQVPFMERAYDVSFTGNFIPNRLDFYRQFNSLSWLPPCPIQGWLFKTAYWKLLKLFFRPVSYENFVGRSKVYFSAGFGTGVSPQVYAETLRQSRIALCPRGYISTECWRIYEALMLGCVVVADELPPTRWYKDAPIITVKNWLNIRKTVETLLEDKPRLLEMHQASLDWWDNVCSEKASAKYLATEMTKFL